ncbi:peptide-methionine (S)-S-oxide reductase MsrA [Flavicella sediminum]|uniref:peptide-methionine (S)-S-oxide reductase MsrA n=1 Tax=Flavicella sediminum TaxID=2585141 RepID=UPI0011234FCC
MKNKFLFLIMVFLFFMNSMQSQNFDKQLKSGELKVAYFASGCFWCVEAIYESIKGVEEVVSGYAGGHTINPTYESTGTGKTGHAETVAVYYNPKIVTYINLVRAYYGSQDPTSFGQKPDFGSAYRSLIFYQNNHEREVAQKYFDGLNTQYDGKVATEIVPFKKFYRAEEYHQNFEKLHPDHRYIQGVSIPRLNRFKKAFPELLK